MTTIAWDGETMAADSYSSLHKNPVVKLHRLRDGSVIGGAGNLESILQAIAWLDDRLDEKPKLTEDSFSLLRAFKDGHAVLYHAALFPVPVRLPYFAIGSGSDYAMAAMSLDTSAHQAIRIATEFDLSTGGDIQTMEV